MKCSNCGEPIQYSDTRCDFCNFDFRTGTPGKVPPPSAREIEAAKRRMIGGLAAGVPLLLLAVAGTVLTGSLRVSKWPLFGAFAALGVAAHQGQLRSRLLKRARLAGGTTP